MTGGGPFRLREGEWTDDTSMALCLGESLLICGDFDARDQMDRYRRWYREGYMSSTGRCFDIGNTVRQAIHSFEATGERSRGPSIPIRPETGPSCGSLLSLFTICQTLERPSRDRGTVPRRLTARPQLSMPASIWAVY